MDILYMQYTIIGVKKELLRLSLRLAHEFDLLNMQMASMLLPSHFPLLYVYILKNWSGQGLGFNPFVKLLVVFLFIFFDVESHTKL